MQRLSRAFFERDILKVAPDLLGCYLVVKNEDLIKRYIVYEVEAYRGQEDLACHASKGRTGRTEIMYHAGGHIYVYLIYGMYWMLNLVTGKKDNPQAILIRGLDICNGPGRVGKLLNLDKSYYGEDTITSKRIWFEKNNRENKKVEITKTPRIGIDYAGEIWKNKPWRFILEA